MRGCAGLVVLMTLAGCDLVFPPGPGPGGDDEPPPPGDWSSPTTGFEHACAIDPDQRLWCWGRNSESQLGDGTTTDRTAPVQIGGTATWLAVSTGDYHTCGIQTNDRVYCWGDDYYGELGTGVVMRRSVPTEITDEGPWRTIAAGSRQTCGIKSPDGSLWCWGDNARGQLGTGTAGPSSAEPVLVDKAGPWRAVAIGHRFTCAVDDATTLWCWGGNDYGELGDLSTPQEASPRQIGVDVGWTAVSAGGATACAIRSGSVHCWGYCGVGACGGGATVSSAPPAAIAAPPGPWSSVDVGWTHACGTMVDGQLWCWGQRDRGSFGDANETSDAEPAPLSVGVGTAWREALAGYAYTCAARIADGVLECAGTNGYGQLGDGAGGPRYSPVQASDPGRTATAITTGGRQDAGTGFGCAVLDDGVYCWGVSDHSQLGVGELTPRRRPLRRDGMMPAKIHAGGSHACELRAGQMYCWGYNPFGQLGVGTTDDEPVPALVGSDWLDVEAGQVHTCGIRADQSAQCWGHNSDGQLGQGDFEDDLMPQALGGLLGIDVAVGGRHTCVVGTDTFLYCAGRNAEGQLGFGDTLARELPTPSSSQNWYDVDAGGFHTCAIDGGGALYCWGRNTYGALGDSTAIDATAPVPVDTPGTWSAVSAGGYHTCGIKADSSLWCWGANWYGQAGLGPESSAHVTPRRVGQDTWTQVSAAEHHTCGIKTDGSVWCWGLNRFGETGDNRAWRPEFRPVTR